MVDEADAPRRASAGALGRELRLEDADEVRVGHRRQRMVAHADSRKQNVADEEMALEDGARVVGESRRRDRERAAELVHQRLERPDRCCRAASNRRSSRT